MSFRFNNPQLAGTAFTLALFGVLGCATNTMADVVAFTPTAPVSEAYGPNSPVNPGLVFTANSSFSVSALGIYDGSYLTGPETVGLYDSVGNLLTSTTVTLADPVVGGDLFQAITPVALTGRENIYRGRTGQ